MVAAKHMINLNPDVHSSQSAPKLPQGMQAQTSLMVSCSHPKEGFDLPLNN